MGIRRKSRELAMQALFFMDTRGPTRERLRLFCKCQPPSKNTYPFFIKLVEGVLANLTHLDGAIEKFSSNWKISRMSCVDRNILRIGAYEMLFCDDIPHKVTINEAIDIGKKYGSEESGAFINGILDSIHAAMEEEPIRIEPPAPAHGAAPAGAEPSEGGKAPEEDRQTPGFSPVRGKRGVVKRRGDAHM